MSEILGERLKSLRKQKGMTQAALAKAIGSSAGYISEIENGSKRPGSEHLFSLKRVFQVSLDELVGGTAPAQVEIQQQFPEYAIDGEALEKAKVALDEIVPSLKKEPDIYQELVLIAAEEFAQLRSLGMPHALKTRVRRWVQTTKLMWERRMQSEAAERDTSASAVKPKP